MAAVFAPDFLAPAGRDVHVTRHFSPLERNPDQKTGTFPNLETRLFSLTSETTTAKNNNFHAEKPRQDLTQEATFCDWVSIYQTHPPGLPVLSDGYFVRFDAEGTHEGTTLKKVRIEGSHETAIFIRSDGETVHFEGNVSKWGRPDNVFGYSFAQCIARINAILQSKGLPPFTAGKKGEVNTPNGWRTQWSGARITRLDLTENFAAGSAEDAYHFMRHLAGQQASRLKTGTHGQGETVDFGRGSRRVYSKAYLKGPELLKHAAKPNKTQTDFSKEYDPYLNDLANWCNSVGLVRFETTYKSTYLIDNGQQFLGGINMAQLEIDFKERQSVFTRANCDVEDISSLDPKTLAIYRMWEAGDDIVSKYKKSQFYKYRSALLPFGVDIAIKSNVIKFQPKTRVIKLEAVKMPDFYKMPPPSFVRLVA